MTRPEATYSFRSLASASGRVPPASKYEGTDQRSIIALLLVPIAVGMFALYDAQSVQDLPQTQRLFAVVVAAAIAVVVVQSSRLHVPWRAHMVVTAVLLLTPVYLLVSVLQAHWLLGYVVGDFFVVLLPLLMTLVFLAEPAALTSPASLGVLGALLFLAAVEAHTVGEEMGRSDPPSVLLISMTWAMALHRHNRGLQLFGWSSALAVGYLSFASGYRTHFVLWLFALPLLLLVLRGIRTTILASIILTAALVVSPLVGYPLNLTEAVQGGRFSTVLGNANDASLQTRFEEAGDALSTASETWLPGQAVFGGGFGATYIPQTVIIEQNVNRYGTVHNIHIGPVLIFFRFGILGLLIFIGLVKITIVGLIRARDELLQGTSLGPVIFSAGAALFLVDFLLRNSSVQPAMAMALGAVLAMWCRSSKDATAPGCRQTRSRTDRNGRTISRRSDVPD